ncbi:Serine/threonine kinase [Physocladia obscura]|uniref:Serine/threonine kinase n=1 Tax=Physocladia obscura TaxID=109957 RepID=A0AAD5T1L2_9FUNG|nr:Serine/threonine kinase [Physocladia obscura]
MAITLVGAFEEVERMKNLRDIEEMERAEKARKENESKLPHTSVTPVVFIEGSTKILISIQIPIMQLPQQQQPTPKRPKQGEVETFLQGRMKLSVEIQRSRPENPRKARKPVKISDFDLVAVLGRGAFGKVLLVEEKSTHQTFAIKALKKDHILQDDGVESAKLEKRIFQIATEHPFLVNMHSSFQDENRLFFVMEYVRGGDLMGHIQQKKYFSLARTKFYACEVLLALEFLHANRIIYRDLKLENILMCADGHIKVADYGICKENIDFGDKTRVCTPDYMAPEILNGEKYGRAVDWWSFGILIYVMLHGRYSYNGVIEKDILKAIYNGKVDFPRKTQTEADIADLLSGLLEKDPRRRLGGGRDDANEIKRHPYFAGIDWNTFMERRVPPPWRPEVKNDRDFSNFKAEFTEQAADLTPMNTVLKPSDQAKFNDFDFVAA